MKACLVLFVLCSSQVFGQLTNRDNYDLKAPKSENDCRDMKTMFRSLPKELRFGTRVRNDSVYLLFPDAEWFARLIASKNDGVAIDLVQQEQFQSCDNIVRFPNSWSHKGYLMPPVYRSQLLSTMKVTRHNEVIVALGRIPNSVKPEHTEANFMLLENRNICDYRTIVSIDFHGWKLLHTGLYYDTLSKEKLAEKYKELRKTLHFTIPFEKNKSQYDPSDLRPMYDSLDMTDYAIRTISIRAFTSVEGSFERNAQLQNERAQSIVSALQSYQTEKIQSNVTTSENWVEFVEDFATSHPELVALTKDEVREKLKTPALLAKLEPVLKQHRKAIIDVTLEKRLSYRESNPGELKKYFQQTIAQKNIDEALYLQWVIFNKIERKEIPDQFLLELEVPETIEWGSLLNNQASFQYEQGFSDVMESLKVFGRLAALIPDNPRILYNLVALRLESWTQADPLMDPTTLKSSIDALVKKGVHPSLVRRLQVNYYIILSARFDSKKQFADKDRALKSVLDIYRKVPLNDNDLVNLAKYFSHYSRFDWAEQVVEPRIKALDVSEDLLFYYLSLTIFDEKNTKSTPYRATMLNAININRKRFCSQFNSRETDGISFQLLTDPYLKKTYCENCQ